jgi:hypothetical protein
MSWEEMSEYGKSILVRSERVFITSEVFPDRPELTSAASPGSSSSSSSSRFLEESDVRDFAGMQRGDAVWTTPRVAAEAAAADSVARELGYTLPEAMRADRVDPADAFLGPVPGVASYDMPEAYAARREEEATRPIPEATLEDEVWTMPRLEEVYVPSAAAEAGARYVPSAEATANYIASMRAAAVVDFRTGNVGPAPVDAFLGPSSNHSDDNYHTGHVGPGPPPGASLGNRSYDKYDRHNYNVPDANNPAARTTYNMRAQETFVVPARRDDGPPDSSNIGGGGGGGANPMPTASEPNYYAALLRHHGVASSPSNALMQVETTHRELREIVNRLAEERPLRPDAVKQAQDLLTEMTKRRDRLLKHRELEAAVSQWKQQAHQRNFSLVHVEEQLRELAVLCRSNSFPDLVKQADDARSLVLRTLCRGGDYELGSPDRSGSTGVTHHGPSNLSIENERERLHRDYAFIGATGHPANNPLTFSIFGCHTFDVVGDGQAERRNFDRLYELAGVQNHCLITKTRLRFRGDEIFLYDPVSNTELLCDPAMVVSMIIEREELAGRRPRRRRGVGDDVLVIGEDEAAHIDPELFFKTIHPIFDDQPLIAAIQKELGMTRDECIEFIQDHLDIPGLTEEERDAMVNFRRDDSVFTKLLVAHAEETMTKLGLSHFAVALPPPTTDGQRKETLLETKISKLAVQLVEETGCDEESARKALHLYGGDAKLARDLLVDEQQDEDEKKPVLEMAPKNIYIQDDTLLGACGEPGSYPVESYNINESTKIELAARVHDTDVRPSARRQARVKLRHANVPKTAPKKKK